MIKSIKSFSKLPSIGNYLIFFLSVVVFIRFEYLASNYDKQITSIFYYKFPNGFKVKYYEGMYHIYDKEKNYPIVYAGNDFPLSQYYESDKNYIVEVRKILKISSKKGNFILFVKLKDGEYRYIIIEEYYDESIIKKYKILNKEEFDILNFKLNWIILDKSPLKIRFWPIVGYLVLIIIFISLYKILEIYLTKKKP